MTPSPGEQQSSDRAPDDARPKKPPFAVLAFGFVVFGAGLFGMVYPAVMPATFRTYGEWIGFPVGAVLGLIAAGLVYALIEPARAFVHAVSVMQDQSEAGENERSEGAHLGVNIDPNAGLPRFVGNWVGHHLGAGFGATAMWATQDVAKTFRENPVARAILKERNEPERPVIDGAPVTPVIESIADDLGREPTQGSSALGFVKLVLIAAGLWVAYLLVKAAFFAEP